jgi:hypothetical protein
LKQINAHLHTLETDGISDRHVRRGGVVNWDGTSAQPGVVNWDGTSAGGGVVKLGRRRRGHTVGTRNVRASF